jgi:hypothetical protein
MAGGSWEDSSSSPRHIGTWPGAGGHIPAAQDEGAFPLGTLEDCPPVGERETCSGGIAGFTACGRCAGRSVGRCRSVVSGCVGGLPTKPRLPRPGPRVCTPIFHAIDSDFPRSSSRNQTGKGSPGSTAGAGGAETRISDAAEVLRRPGTGDH